MPNVRVRPKDANATHDISLSDGVNTWGITLKEGARGIQESPATPSNIRITGGGTKFGDYDPMMSHIEQRDWSGGRGSEYFADDPTRYYDAKNAWTLTPGKLHQTPQWGFGEGYYYADNLLPDSQRRGVGNNVKWQAVTSSAYYARSFTAEAVNAYDMNNVQMWVRRVGSPSHKLTVELYSSGSNKPGTLLGTGTLSSVGIDDGPSQLVNFAISSAAGETLTQSTAATYWVVARSSAAGSLAHHWELGYSSSNPVSGSTTMYSADGTTYSTGSTHLYFRVTKDLLDRKWRFFELDSALYAVDQSAGGDESTLYINGDRGKATGGSSTSLTQTGKTWATDIWAGAWVKTTAGTGAGQKAQITANSATVLTATFPIAVAAATEYVIYGTNEWTALSSAGYSSAFDCPVKDVAVGNKIAYFANGVSTGIGGMRWNSSLHEFAKVGPTSAAECADSVHVFYDPVDGAQIWRGVSSAAKVYRSTIPAWGSTFVWSPSSGIPIAEQSYGITDLCDYNDQLYVFKEDSLWAVKNDRAAKVPVGLGAMPSSQNGAAWAVKDLFLYFTWSHSVERFYGGTLDDIGPWKGAGLPDARRGPVVSMLPVISWLFAAVDAGSTGVSSVLAYDGNGWHEVMRGWRAGRRIQGLAWQACPGTNPRLWVSCGGDIMYMKFPKDTLNPLRDASFKYQHEFELETSTIDMGASQLPKLFHQLHAITENLGGGKEIHVDYQLDDNIGSSSWNKLSYVNASPSAALTINRGDKVAIRLRLRGVTNSATTPTVVNATVLEGIARTPVKRQWNIRANTGSFQVTQMGLKDTDPDDFYTWFQDAAATAKPLHMRAKWRALDDIWVFAEAPTIARDYTTPSGEWGGNFGITVREV